MDAEKSIDEKKRVRFAENLESKPKKIKTKPKTILLLSAVEPPLAPPQPILKTHAPTLPSQPPQSAPRGPFFRVEAGNPDF